MIRTIHILFFLFASEILSAQNSGATELQQEFENYQTFSVEKIFLHTDKSFYLVGETIWIKVYKTDISSLQPFEHGGIAYIEILNNDLKPVLQTKISLNGSTGSGSLTIPTFLNTGAYIIRAYTNWMKNFSPEFYYEQRLEIVNTLNANEKPLENKLNATVRFFPEGGNAVYGLKSKIAFKALDAFGRGIECYGSIVNQNNDSIVSIRSTHKGMGNFILTPEKGSTYFAVLHINDKIIKQKLPDPQENGLVMQVDKSEGQFVVTVRGTSELNNTNIFLFIQSGQLAKHIETTVIKKGEAQFSIASQFFGNGISTITIFNQQRQPVCERLVFNRAEDSFHIQVGTDQLVYQNRKPVRVDLIVSTESKKTTTGNFSLAVIKIDSLQPIPEQNIISYLYLNSELKGVVESPQFYFTNLDDKTNEAMDNLLLTQGWRRFVWDEIWGKRKPIFEFLPEVEGPIITGKITNKITGANIANADVFLSVLGAGYDFASATSGTDGFVKFGLKNIYKNTAVVVQPAEIKDSIYRIDINNSFSDKFSSRIPNDFTAYPTKSDLLLKRSIAMQVENTYDIERKRQFLKSNTDSTAFYGNPDKQYNLDDYTRFETMEEVMREYIDDVRVRKEGAKFIFKVRNSLFGTYFEENPLILLDGIPVADGTKIISQNPLNIRKVEIVSHKYYIGSSVFEGIVNVKSYNGELGATVIDPGALVIEYEGLQQQREFYSPVYSTQAQMDSHLPDFRTTLYWLPEIISAGHNINQPSFYTSDVPGRYAIIIQGLFSNGVPANAISFFDVMNTN